MKRDEMVDRKEVIHRLVAKLAAPVDETLRRMEEIKTAIKLRRLK